MKARGCVVKVETELQKIHDSVIALRHERLVLRKRLKGQFSRTRAGSHQGSREQGFLQAIPGPDEALKRSQD